MKNLFHGHEATDKDRIINNGRNLVTILAEAGREIVRRGFNITWQTSSLSILTHVTLDIERRCARPSLRCLRLRYLSIGNVFEYEFLFAFRWLSKSSSARSFNPDHRAVC